MRKSLLLIALALLPLFSSAFPTALADKGIVSMDPAVSVYEPGQKAIVAWNGREEILILSTDVNASKDTWALEIMPLPSKPNKIEKASFESFVRLQGMILEHASEVLGEDYRGADQTKSVEIVFHEKIGAHEITVAEANNASEFVKWADSFLEANDIGQKVSLQKFESVIEDYMVRGFRFFVLDLMEITPRRSSVEPILYRFETSFLYYPLKISSPNSGDTKITLFLITEGMIRAYSQYPPYYPLAMSFYHTAPNVWEPIQFNLTHGELQIIDLRIGELFENTAYLTVMEYEGLMSRLTTDLMITEASVTSEHDTLTLSPIGAVILVMITGTLCTSAGVLLGFLAVRTKRSKK